ncbi:MAG: PspC domain-containing protein [Coriobacteriales bacterium]|jgi:phage shock protein C|nr:PspC domain-containing protein [Coriobacteriales bacterium]
MSRKYLHKSSDCLIAGVCGGVAEYFGADPTLVRILAIVLFALGGGLPALVYIVAAVLLPPDPALAQGYVDAKAEQTRTPHTPGSCCGGEKTGAYQASGVPTTKIPDTTTDTRNPRADRYAHDTTLVRHWPSVCVLAALLISVGVLVLLIKLVNPTFWRFWPLIGVVTGLVLLFTPNGKGWSLERAGRAIALITSGLVVLAWMLNLLSSLGFVNTFSHLWPVLLIVIGLNIIGSALRSSALRLLSSLLFSASLLSGLWLYGGIVEQATVSIPDGRNLAIAVPRGPTLPAYPDELPTLAALEMAHCKAGSFALTGGGASITVLATHTSAIELSGYTAAEETAQLYFMDASNTAARLDLPSLEAHLPTVVSLPASVQWQTLGFDTGASALNLNLEELVVRHLNLSMGATVSEILLGAPLENGSVLTIDSSCAGIKLRLPEQAPCTVTVEGISSVVCDDGSFRYDEQQHTWYRQSLEQLSFAQLDTIGAVTDATASSLRSADFPGSDNSFAQPSAADPAENSGWIINIRGLVALDLGISHQETQVTP